ncbi:MAG: gamma-glutamyltransferase [Rhodospirillaceae bacterium]|nr:gamma-glutamyltransferase [Rhodospirillaceae bacterium]|tara:strand:+ start:7122 stop:8711 length:1590 start_codon:yes stop_codon:yes gene_type:complete
MRSTYSPPRSTAYAEHGMACTSHPAASMAALDILRQGGNAMDAAIAAAATLTVVEPMSTGVGGDVFCLYAPKGTADIIAYNGSGRAPGKADAAWFLDNGIDKIGNESPHAVTVPGTIDAWCRLADDHGNMEISEVLHPAIHHAEEGYTVAPVVHEAWVDAEERLSKDAHAPNVLLVAGKAPAVGSIHHQPLLAATLKAVADQGRDGFYTGWVAEDIVAYLNELGGLHTLDDFASAAGEYVEPISTTMNGYRVHECPPNGQGIVALIMMNILKGYDIASMGPLSADRLHHTIEAGRLAFRDRAEYVADPAMADIPVETLLSEAYAEQLRGDIDPERAMDEVPGPSLPSTPNTVYLTVVDKDRNAASFINSTYFSFGSSRVAPKSGVVLQNRGAGFVIEPGHRNCIAPGKRPMHTIIPAMLTRDDKAMMPFGVMGGDYQPWGHTHVLQNMLLYGMDPQAALDLPRYCHERGAVYVEPSIPDHVMHDLARRGHDVRITPEAFGGGQAIWIDWAKGTLAGGTEPRKDGIALGY